jgi:RNA polymerase sigma factor (sigma-70 family)
MPIGARAWAALQAASGPPLTPAEERDLARRARAGDPAARDELICRNLRLALAFALRPRRGDGDDHLGAALVGLIRAVDQFRPERGARFARFAARLIVRQMVLGDNDSRPVPVPAYLAHALHQERWSGPPKLRPDQYRCLDDARSARDLDFAPLDAGRDVPAPEGSATPAAPSGVAERLLAVLGDRERAVVRLRHCLDGPAMPFVEIAASVGCSKTTAILTYRAALVRLRAEAERLGLAPPPTCSS